MPKTAKSSALPFNPDAMLEFVEYPDHAENTQKQYITVARTFLHWCADRGLHPDHVTATHLQRFLDDRGLSRSSQLTYMQALSALYGILQDRGLADDNPTSSWSVQYRKKKGKPGPRVAKRLPTVLDSDEETRLLAAIPLESPLPFSVYRKRVFLHLLLFTGLRVSEALSLTLGQVRLEADPPVVRVIGKGNKEREVPISPTLQVVLEGYLERRQRFVRNGNWLFSTAVGAPLTRTWAYTTVSEAIRGAGIQKPAYGPHVLRHTFATRQLRAGIAPAIVKAWLGHEDLAITFRVYEHVIAAPAGVRPV
ncbi:recombinase XerD [Acidithiobacillus caldus]|uniref:Recombinase XerD n=2 Tax=Acidithiobacillus caldus TaxID=33059 RepID=A0A1E7YQ55_9PROT|nr:tyrosine-type recombinase/integrase [Acidithiobacillus caldus]OFC37630.1 recombinase XerD [Acidithiobacillus caldus]OFC37754.1 recombinase XerD [Acidithiobacillus caldus]OFC37874.1 recombinase XerD [Acidithiobacillus caldus]